MGGSVSQVFRSGSALLSNSHGHKISEGTSQRVQTVFDALRANPKVTLQRLEALLLEIPKYENILAIHDEAGYNLLQKCVGLNHVDLARWLLNRHSLDVNRSACSLPLHIACLKGHEECVELLLRHGAKIDTDARMCFPGSHSHNCEESGKYSVQEDSLVERPLSKLQGAVLYAIDGDKVGVLNILAQKMEEPWMPFRARKPLLHLACERSAWQCVQHLVNTRSDEIHVMKDEFFPLHHTVLHDIRFLELLIQHGADTTVRTCTQQMTLLHVVLLVARKSAEDTLNTIKVLLEHGCKDLINTADSIGNTPLHALIVRYALEEARYGYEKWNKWDVLHLVRYLLQNGARYSINQAGNSALACVLRHVRDWDVCYELLNMLLTHGGEPNMVGRDGSVPIMVCLVPLINKDPLHHFTHSMKVCYLNCIRILLQYGANPNCSYQSNLTPLHVLIFTVSENITLNCDVQKKANFDFIKNLLVLLLQHGLDCNVRMSSTSQHILQSCMDMIQYVRSGADMACVHELALTLIQNGADPNTCLSTKSLEEGSRSETDSNRGSFRNNSRNYILYYFISLITKKDIILLDPTVTYSKIIYLFYMTMDHEPLYSCLKSLHTQYIAQVPVKTTEALMSLVSDLYKKPRTLKQLCRVRVYNCLKRKPALYVSKVNCLPGSLKDYVLNFEN